MHKMKSAENLEILTICLSTSKFCRNYFFVVLTLASCDLAGWRVARGRLPAYDGGTCARADTTGYACASGICRTVACPRACRACRGYAPSGCSGSRRTGGSSDT